MKKDIKKNKPDSGDIYSEGTGIVSPEDYSGDNDTGHTPNKANKTNQKNRSEDDSWFGQAATSRAARLRFDKNRSEEAYQTRPPTRSHQNEENPTHYSGYKEDRDYSYNQHRLHPEPHDRGYNNNDRYSQDRDTYQNQQRFAGNDRNSSSYYNERYSRNREPYDNPRRNSQGQQNRDYSPSDLSSRDYYDSRPSRQQRPNQEEGQGYKQGHSSSSRNYNDRDIRENEAGNIRRNEQSFRDDKRNYDQNYRRYHKY